MAQIPRGEARCGQSASQLVRMDRLTQPLDTVGSDAVNDITPSSYKGALGECLQLATIGTPEAAAEVKAAEYIENAQSVDFFGPVAAPGSGQAAQLLRLRPGEAANQARVVALVPP